MLYPGKGRFAECHVGAHIAGNQRRANSLKSRSAHILTTADGKNFIRIKSIAPSTSAVQSPASGLTMSPKGGRFG